MELHHQSRTMMVQVIVAQFLIALDGPPDRHRGRPAESPEQPADVVLVVANAELLLDDESDAGAGPDLAPKALGLRAMPEELRDEALLLGSQPGDPARGGMGAKGLGAVPLRDGKPVADGGVGDAESPGDRPLRPAFVLERQRPHPPPLHPIPESRTRGLHTPFYGPEKLSSLRSDQEPTQHDLSSTVAPRFST